MCGGPVRGAPSTGATIPTTNVTIVSRDYFRAMGIALVVVAYLDALATTVVVREGAGPVTRWLTGFAWRAALRLRLDAEVL